MQHNQVQSQQAAHPAAALAKLLTYPVRMELRLQYLTTTSGNWQNTCAFPKRTYVRSAAYAKLSAVSLRTFKTEAYRCCKISAVHIPKIPGWFSKMYTTSQP
jgi:hypothetical protein